MRQTFEDSDVYGGDAMSNKIMIIAKNMIVFGVLPATSFIVARFGYIYAFDVRKIDADFLGTSLGITMIFLLIGFFIGLNSYKTRTQFKNDKLRQKRNG